MATFVFAGHASYFSLQSHHHPSSITITTTTPIQPSIAIITHITIIIITIRCH